MRTKAVLNDGKHLFYIHLVRSLLILVGAGYCYCCTHLARYLFIFVRYEVEIRVRNWLVHFPYYLYILYDNHSICLYKYFHFFFLECKNECEYINKSNLISYRFTITSEKKCRKKFLVNRLLVRFFSHVQ